MGTIMYDKRIITSSVLGEKARKMVELRGIEPLTSTLITEWSGVQVPGPTSKSISDFILIILPPTTRNVKKLLI